MSTATLPDIELIEALDFDIETACEQPNFDCGRAVEWMLVRACCGTVLAVCDECKDFQTTDSGIGLECDSCLKFFHPPALAYCHIERVRRRGAS